MNTSKQIFVCPKKHKVNNPQSNGLNTCPIKDCSERSWKILEIMCCNACGQIFKSTGESTQKCSSCGKKVLEQGIKYGSS